VTNKIINIYIIGLQFALFSLFGFSEYSGWDRAEVKQLEQNTFLLNDEITNNEFQKDEKWIVDIRNEVFNMNDEEAKPHGLTIAVYE
jgi:hypothetical protein